VPQSPLNKFRKGGTCEVLRATGCWEHRTTTASWSTRLSSTALGQMQQERRRNAWWPRCQRCKLEVLWIMFTKHVVRNASEAMRASAGTPLMHTVLCGLSRCPAKLSWDYAAHLRAPASRPTCSLTYSAMLSEPPVWLRRQHPRSRWKEVHAAVSNHVFFFNR
jgi:hypothetical protein